MGWLFRTGLSRKELIAERTRDWSKDMTGGTTIKTTCLAHCYRGNAYSGVLWSVFERTFTDDGEQVQPTERWIACDLLRHRKDSGWGYKDMDESAHPFYYSCPLKYLNMVPIEQYGGNQEWRDCVQSYHEQRKQRRQKQTA